MYLFVDTETTGLDPKRAAIVQLAALIVDKDGYINGEFDSRIRPHEGAIIEGGALAINKRKHDELLNAPTNSEVCERFRKFVGPRELVFAGYNCPFDQKFVWALFGLTGIYTKYIIPKEGPLDVLGKARKLVRKPTEVENHKLGTVAKFFGQYREGAHNALEDLYMTVNVWKCLKVREAEIKAGVR